MRTANTHAQLVLGTAPLAGTLADTSAANTSRAVLKAALHAGLRWVDTSPAHDGVETLVGQALRGDSRMHVIARLEASLTAAPARKAIEEGIDRAAARLGLGRIGVLMLDSPDAITAHDGRLWRLLKELRDEGRIYDLGVSVASPEEALRAIAEPAVTYLQLQFNALDWRWHETGVVQALAARPEILVHAHSALLHGLLAGTPGARWPSPEAANPESLRLTLWTMAKDMGRDCPADLCIAYVRAQAWIHGVIAGARVPAQLALNIARFRRPPLNADEIARMNAAMPHGARGSLQRGPARLRIA